VKVRIRFSKYGPLRFIGHLDVMRYFQKAIRRCGIPIAYSEGFSPHQIMSFAAPLSVGHTSEGEYMDIEVADPLGESVSGEEIPEEKSAAQKSAAERELKDALQAVMVDGISVLDVRILPVGEKNAMASVAAASYLISFRQGTLLPRGWQEKLLAFYGQEEIPVMKKTKKSEKQMNLKESIYQLEIRDESVYMMLDASSGGNMKPAFVLECFFKTMDYELPAFALMIHRLEIYKNVGNEDDRKLVPLIWEK